MVGQWGHSLQVVLAAEEQLLAGGGGHDVVVVVVVENLTNENSTILFHLEEDLCDC